MHIGLVFVLLVQSRDEPVTDIPAHCKLYGDKTRQVGDNWNQATKSLLFCRFIIVTSQARHWYWRLKRQNYLVSFVAHFCRLCLSPYGLQCTVTGQSSWPLLTVFPFCDFIQIIDQYSHSLCSFDAEIQICKLTYPLWMIFLCLKKPTFFSFCIVKWITGRPRSKKKGRERREREKMTRGTLDWNLDWFRLWCNPLNY